MARVLNCGESLLNGRDSWDAFGKFQLVMQSDGNLVTYAYAIHPTRRKFASGATMSTAFGPNTILHLTDDGILQYRDSNDLKTKLDISPHYWDHDRKWRPAPPKAGSTLELQEDGNLVLYGPDGFVYWSMGHLLQDLDPENNPNASKLVNPNFMVLKINGKLSSTGGIIIYNWTESPINYYDDVHRPALLPPREAVCLADDSPKVSVFKPVFSGNNDDSAYHIVDQRLSRGVYYIDQVSDQSVRLSPKPVSPIGLSFVAALDTGVGYYISPCKHGYGAVCGFSTERVMLFFKFVKQESGLFLYNIGVSNEQLLKVVASGRNQGKMEWVNPPLQASLFSVSAEVIRNEPTNEFRFLRFRIGVQELGGRLLRVDKNRGRVVDAFENHQEEDSSMFHIYDWQIVSG